MRDATHAPWQLEPASAAARAWLLGLTTLLPVLITGAAIGLGISQGETPKLFFDDGPLGLVLTFALVALIGAAVGVAIHLAMRRHRITLDANGIEVATTFYKRRLGWGELKLDEARVVDLDEHTDYKPSFKSNGTAIPGFRSGWFRMRNRQKAFVAMAGGPRVLLLPTTQGYTLLLQPRQPKSLLDELKATSSSR